MTTNKQGDTGLPCPHGRSSWKGCPHCLGLNAQPSPDNTVEQILNDLLSSVDVVHELKCEDFQAGGCLDTHISSGDYEHATQAINQYVQQAIVAELKAFKANFATSLDVETYDALANRINQLKGGKK